MQAKSKYQLKQEKNKAKEEAKKNPRKRLVDQKKYRIKIAQITLAYHNADVIEWVRTRGSYIQTEKWDKLHEINKEISEGL
jgi:hypothetical protein